MALAITIGSAVLVLGFGLLGAVRDLPRGILAFAGVLFGVVLVSLWAAPLASDLGRRFGNGDAVQLLRVASIGIFSVATLLIGFGAGVLLPKTTNSTATTRLIGGVLGVFTGALAGGFLLSYASAANPTFLTQVRASSVGQVLLDRLPLLLLGGAGLVVVAVVIRVLLGFFAKRRPTNAGRVASTNPAATNQQAAEKATLNKIDKRIIK